MAYASLPPAYQRAVHNAGEGEEVQIRGVSIGSSTQGYSASDLLMIVLTNISIRNHARGSSQTLNPRTVHDQRTTMEIARSLSIVALHTALN